MYKNDKNNSDIFIFVFSCIFLRNTQRGLETINKIFSNGKTNEQLKKITSLGNPNLSKKTVGIWLHCSKLDQMDSVWVLSKKNNLYNKNAFFSEKRHFRDLIINNEHNQYYFDFLPYFGKQNWSNNLMKLYKMNQI